MLASSPSTSDRATVVGEARDAKGGAVVLTSEGAPVYLVGMPSWPDPVVGRRVEATGEPARAHHLPVATTSPGGEISQGVASDAGPQQILRNPSWALAADPSLVPTAPWALTWADGSGNVSRVWMDAEGGSASLATDPVRPETSSSGMYSGGEPRLETLPPERVVELWALARTVAWGAPRAPTRAKGTGLLTLTEPGGQTEALVEASAASTALDAALRRP